MTPEILLTGLTSLTAWAILKLVKRICNIPEELK